MAHHQVHKKFQVSTVVNKPVEEVWKTIDISMTSGSFVYPSQIYKILITYA